MEKIKFQLEDGTEAEFYVEEHGCRSPPARDRFPA